MRERIQKMSGPNDKVEEMTCPACAEIIKKDRGVSLWKCDNCGFSISDAELKDGVVFWFCDECESFMNIQPGFNTKSGRWTCAECGFDNGVTEGNVFEK
jgi:ribosomal protein L37AE/L43A